MARRLHEPDVLATAAVGSVFLIGYLRPVTVEIELRVEEDLGRFYDERPGAIQVLTSNPFVPFPLPPVEVRAMWRKLGDGFPRMNAAAIVASRVVGLSGAVFTSMLEQLVAPVVRGRALRTFTDADAAVIWLCNAYETGCGFEELREAFTEVLPSR